MKRATLFVGLLAVLLSIAGCDAGGAGSEAAIDADPGEPRIREERPVPSPRAAAEPETAPDENQGDSANELTVEEADDGVDEEAGDAEGDAEDAATDHETAESTEETTPEPPDDSDGEPAPES